MKKHRYSKAHDLPSSPSHWEMRARRAERIFWAGVVALYLIFAALLVWGITSIINN